MKISLPVACYLLAISFDVTAIADEPTENTIFAKDAKLERLHTRQAKLNSPNDLCVDLKGRIYFTDPRYGGTEPRELAKEAVYRIEKDGAVIKITQDVEKPNGLALSPDQQTLYIVDHNNGGNRLSPND